MKLNAQELRELEVKKAQGVVRKVQRNPIYFILENIYDTYNIGGLFRLADAIAAEKIYLCGETEIPPNSRIKKASIGTYKIVDWQYTKTVKQAVDNLKSNIKYQRSNIHIKNQKYNNITMKQYNNELKIIAVEQNTKAISYTKADYSLPVALIFGNESYGVTSQTLELVDQIVEIPMWGINRSLNVIVSAAVVSYWIMSKQLTNRR